MSDIAKLNHTLPSPMVVIDSALALKVRGIVAVASSFQSVGEDSIERANVVIRDVAALAKEIEQNRKRVKEPVDELARRIQTAAKSVSVPLDRAKRELEDKIAKHAEAVEAERQRIEAANAARMEEARKEQERIRQEAQRQLEESLARKQAELEAEAKKNKPSLLGKLLGKPAPEPLALPDPVVAPAIPAPAIAVALEPVPDRVKSPVSTRRREVLVITDASLIPLEVAGVQLMKPDEAAITRLLKAKVSIPGCHLGTATSHATRTA